jgi:hypothetical protein
MKKIVLIFGLISGAVSAVVMLATARLMGSIGYDKAEVIGYTGIVLSALLIFFGIRAYREGAGGGRLTFGRGLAVGVLITLVSSLCYVLAFQIIYFQWMPDFGAKFVVCMVDRVRASGASAEKVAEATRQAQEFKRLYDNPATNAALTFLEPFPIGVVVTVISAALLRKK